MMHGGPKNILLQCGFILTVLMCPTKHGQLRYPQIGRHSFPSPAAAGFLVLVDSPQVGRMPKDVPFYKVLSQAQSKIEICRRGRFSLAVLLPVGLVRASYMYLRFGRY